MKFNIIYIQQLTQTQNANKNNYIKLYNNFM